MTYHVHWTGEILDLKLENPSPGDVIGWDPGEGVWMPVPGGGGGEVNTSSNLGTGEGLAAPKAGVDLPFKSLVAGANISLSSDADEVTIDSPVTAARKNLLINGDFRIWQRGYNSFTPGNYNADRWTTSGSYEEARETVTIPNDQFTRSLWIRNPAANPIQIRQAIECPDDSRPPIPTGQEITISFWARVPVGERIGVTTFWRPSPNSGIAVTDLAATFPATGSSPGWDKVEVTYTSTAARNPGDHYVVALSFPDSGGGDIVVTGVQVEYGDTATDFEYRHISEELAMCQRYYQTFDFMVMSVGVVATGSEIFSNWVFPVEMRVAPTTTIFNDIGGVGFTPGTVALNAPGIKRVRFANTAAADSNSGYWQHGFTLDAEI